MSSESISSSLLRTAARCRRPAATVGAAAGAGGHLSSFSNLKAARAHQLVAMVTQGSWHQMSAHCGNIRALLKKDKNIFERRQHNTGLIEGGYIWEASHVLAMAGTVESGSAVKILRIVALQTHPCAQPGGLVT